MRRIPAEFLDPAATMVVYTPAVPQEHGEYQYFVSHGFCVEKRSQMLGHLAEGKYVMAVAGTHGKTTTSTLVAWLNRVRDGRRISAFLGGISKNFGGNLVLGAGARLAVEADEFDRSFLRLYPDVAVITSADADHLDIYGTHEAVKEAFSQFVRQIRPGGFLIIKAGGGYRAGQSADHRLPLFVRRAVRLLRPQRAAARRRALPLRHCDARRRGRGVHARHSGMGQYREFGGGRGVGVVRGAGRRHGRSDAETAARGAGVVLRA